MRRAPILALLLAACGGRPDGDPARAVPGDRLGDPAIAAAINAPIMTDPGLSQSANADAIRPPSRPDPLAVPAETLGAPPDPVNRATLRHAPAPGACPQCRIARASLTLGALAGARAPGCAGSIRYAGTWAEGLPLYPDARLVEGAGSDAAGCRLRIAAFASRAPVGTVVDWYFTRDAATRHAADGPLHVLEGRGYFLHATARADGGTDAILLVDAR